GNIMKFFFRKIFTIIRKIIGIELLQSEIAQIQKSLIYSSSDLHTKRQLFFSEQLIMRKELYPNIKVHDFSTTFHELLNSNKSFIRFSDCEFWIMFGHHGVFQEYDKNLQKRLVEISCDVHNPYLMIGVNLGLFCTYSSYHKVPRLWTLENTPFTKALQFVVEGGEYWDASALRSHPYLFFSELSEKTSLLYREVFADDHINKIDPIYKEKWIEEYIKPLKMSWSNKNIIVIEGEHSRVGMDNDLFNTSESVDRIIGSAVNAFNEFDRLYKESLATASKYNKDNVLFILALGATATVLSYDLHKQGYRAWDSGNFSILYDFVLGSSGLSNINDINDPQKIAQRSLQKQKILEHN
ncbi:MAG: GT-D fold domain-containing glycosyltransferase, partial [Brevinema sp.]